MSDLTPEQVVPRLRGRLGVPYDYRKTCASTQLLLLGSGLPEGATAVAEHQTAGRGRRGTTWQDAPARALLCSVLLRSPPAADAAPFALVAGLAVADAIAELTAVPTMLKWPNDVLVEGHKLAGLLLEQDVPELVCGIGVNVNQRSDELPVDVRTRPTSLSLVTGHDHDRGRVLVEILALLERWLDVYRSDGLAGVLPAIRARDALLGLSISVGEELGVAAGIADDGALLLETRDGRVRPVTSGEVTVLSPVSRR